MASVLDDCKQQMEATITALKRELMRLRTGRATTALLDGIMVNYYGTKTPLNQLATVTVADPKLLVIQPFDKSAAHEIERAILQSDLGLTPMNDGKAIRVPIPELTEERRRELVKHVRRVAEEYRVSVRTHRRDANEFLKEMHKAKELTEDELAREQAKVEQLTKEYIEKVDKIVKAKEQEVMEV